MDDWLVGWLDMMDGSWVILHRRVALVVIVAVEEVVDGGGGYYDSREGERETRRTTNLYVLRDLTRERES